MSATEAVEKHGGGEAAHPAPREFRGGGRFLSGGAAAAVVGGALVAFGVSSHPARAYAAYLAAYTFAVTIALGALIFVMIVHAMNATWPVAVRRVVEALAGTLPLMAILFIPVIVGMKYLYPWVAPATDHMREVVAKKHQYLNVTFFIVRAVIYWAIWLGLEALLRRWSLQQDSDPSPAIRLRQRKLSAAFLPVMGITTTFAGMDWLMSLRPDWTSTMFGLIFFADGFILALCLITVLTRLADEAGYLPGITKKHYYALGRLMLGFLIFWAYVNFFQFMLIWIGNKPTEVPYFVARMYTSWWVESVVLMVGHFGLPFLALLSYKLKHRPRLLAAVAGWLVLNGIIEAHWLVVPEIERSGFTVSWMDLAAFAAVVGAALAFGVWRQRGHALQPVRDPLLPAARQYQAWS